MPPSLQAKPFPPPPASPQGITVPDKIAQLVLKLRDAFLNLADNFAVSGLGKHLSKFRQKMMDMMSFNGGGLSSLLGPIIEAFEDIVGGAASFFGDVKDFAGGLTSFIQDPIDTVQGIVDGLGLDNIPFEMGFVESDDDSGLGGGTSRNGARAAGAGGGSSGGNTYVPREPGTQVDTTDTVRDPKYNVEEVWEVGECVPRAPRTCGSRCVQEVFSADDNSPPHPPIRAPDPPPPPTQTTDTRWGGRGRMMHSPQG